MHGFDAFDVPTSGEQRAYRLLLPDADWWVDALFTALTELGEFGNWGLNGNADTNYCARSGMAINASVRRSVNLLGMVMPFAGSVLPVGCLWCDGTQYLQTAYPALYGLVGASFGTADADYFRVPDLRGRVPMGSGTGAGLTARAVGDVIGEEAHSLSTGELPAHAHSDTGHQHTTGNSFTFLALTGEEPVLMPNPLPALTGLASANITNTGGDGAHNNVQPSLGLAFVIVAVDA